MNRISKVIRIGSMFSLVRYDFYIRTVFLNLKTHIINIPHLYSMHHRTNVVTHVTIVGKYLNMCLGHD